jgi:hypothetical protein
MKTNKILLRSFRPASRAEATAIVKSLSTGSALRRCQRQGSVKARHNIAEGSAP